MEIHDQEFEQSSTEESSTSIHPETLVTWKLPETGQNLGPAYEDMLRRQGFVTGPVWIGSPLFNWLDLNAWRYMSDASPDEPTIPIVLDDDLKALTVTKIELVEDELALEGARLPNWKIRGQLTAEPTTEVQCYVEFSSECPYSVRSQRIARHASPTDARPWPVFYAPKHDY